MEATARPTAVILDHGLDTSTAKQRDFGAAAHIISAFLIPFSLGISILLPASLYFFHNHFAESRDEFLINHMREAFNANVSFLFAALIHGALMFVLIGFLTFPIHWILLVLWSFKAQRSLKSGEFYRYPFTVRIF
jgi:hypothetical protein